MFSTGHIQNIILNYILGLIGAASYAVSQAQQYSLAIEFFKIAVAAALPVFIKELIVLIKNRKAK